MKRLTVTLLAFILAIALTACQEGEERSAGRSQPTQTQEPLENEALEISIPEATQSNILIAYFTLGRNAEYPDDIDANTSASLVLDNEELIGTTEYIARLIQDNIGGDLYSIRTVEAYSTDFDTVVDQNHEEMVVTDLDVSEYNTVFIGYPVWATNAPQAIFSFLSQYDLSGKTIIPFCTHDGYGAGSSYGDIADAIDGETEVLDGLAIEALDVPGSADTVIQWLQSLNIEQSGNIVRSDETAITITIDDMVLNGVLYDTPLAHEIQKYFPLTISMVGFGGREYYGGVDFYPENVEGGQTTFENGDITYCEAHHNMAIFYAQTDDPVLSVDVIPIGRVTSDLAIFDQLSRNVNVTFALAE